MARVTGLFGSLYLAGSGTKIADLLNWEFEARTDILPCGIKMDFYEISVAGHASARVRAERIPNQTGILFAYSQDHAVNGNPVAFVLDVVDATSGYTTITGNGFAEAGTLNAPRDKVSDTFELIVDGAYVIATA